MQARHADIKEMLKLGPPSLSGIRHSCLSCYNSQSSRPKGLLGSVCAHTGDRQPYLAQGGIMQSNRRVGLGVHVRRSKKIENTYKQGRLSRVCWPTICNASMTGNHKRCSKPQQFNVLRLC